MKFFNIFHAKEDPQLASPTAGLAEQIRAATKMEMDGASRDKMRAQLFEYAKLHPIRGRAATAPAPSNFLIYAMSQIRPMPVMAAVLIVAVSGGTVAAAEGALPGDMLYPIKVHVTEEVRVAFAATPQARAAIAVERAERRLEEAAMLSLSGKLPDEVRAEIDANFKQHVEDAEDDGMKLASSNEQKDATEVRKNVGAMRVARENILERRVARAAKAVAARAVSADSAATMSMSAELQVLTAQQKAASEADDDDAKVQGQRTAAKVRIDASKKFLEHPNRPIGTTTRERAQERLKSATEAFSSGEAGEARGNKKEASVNFNSALEATVEIEDLVSDSSDDDENSDDDSRDEDGDKKRSSDSDN